MSNGWIKIHRKIQNHWLYTEKPFSKFQAFMDILLEVNHLPAQVNLGNHIIECKRGESLNSLDTWAMRWGWDKSKVRRFLVLLESGSIIDTLPCVKTTHLKVVNYDTYQNPQNADETQMKRKRNADETRLTPNKNNKNEKNDKNVKNSAFKKPSFEELEQYSTEIEFNLDCEQFLDFYESKGWVVGKSPMKNWKAAVRTWQKRDQERHPDPCTATAPVSEEELEIREEQARRQGL